MAPVFPNICISCPCSETGPSATSTSTSAPLDFDPDFEEEDSRPFDPRNPRSAFSLYPLENLLYCEDCHQIRCPRCVQEEIVCYFCPSCLFEVPSSTVKTEGNRCTRNCFQCPICFASVSVTAAAEQSMMVSSLAPSGESLSQPTGPFLLTCPYCHWSSREIELEFDKPSNLTAQFAKQLKAASELAEEEKRPKYAQFAGQEEGFAKLKAHYSSQGIGAAGSGLSVGRGADEYGTSPGALSRLMGLYTGGVGRRTASGLGGRGPSGVGSGRDGGKKIELTEAPDVKEIDDDARIIRRLMKVDFDETSTQAQSLCQPHHPKFIAQLRPIATLLRTKRSKRCRACRHILVKPEPKVQGTRYRIKLVAMNYVPAINISRLDPNISYNSLVPLNTHSFLLTVTNPLFDPINVILATPQKTPGKYPSIVTILCPEFSVGANTDAWDEALHGDDKTRGAGGGKSTTSGREKNTQSSHSGGTVYDHGRNWSTVVIEVIPPVVEGRMGNAGRFGAGGGFVGSGPGGGGGAVSPVGRSSPFGTPALSPLPLGLRGAGAGVGPGGPQGFLGAGGEEEVEDERDEEDEKVVQVPIFVRVEYEAEVGVDDAGGEAAEGKREKKEHAYWCVLYLGRIGSGTGPLLGSGGGAGGGSVGVSGSGSGSGSGQGTPLTVVGMAMRDASGGSLGGGSRLSRSSTSGRERG